MSARLPFYANKLHSSTVVVGKYERPQVVLTAGALKYRNIDCFIKLLSNEPVILFCDGFLLPTQC